MAKLSAESIKTSIFKKGDDLIQFLIDHTANLDLEGSVLAITSKIVSLAEGRTVARNEISKRDLVIREADRFLGVGGYDVELTIKHGIFIASAGIDESNSESGDYILFPENPYASAQKIWQAIKQKRALKNFGVIITDSHVIPLRKGVTGIGLSHYGFNATKSLVGTNDLFNRSMKFTSVNVLDALAGIAVFVMGESDDRCPLALVEKPEVEFTQTSSADEAAIAPELDLFFPVLASNAPK